MAGHFSRRQLLAFLSLSDPPTREDFEELLEHVLDECPVCKAELEALVRPEPPADWTTLIPHAVAIARSNEAAWTRFSLIAEAEAAELVGLPADLRRLKIHRAYTRFRNPALVDLLLEESRGRISSDPSEAYDLAECAHAVAMRLSWKEVSSTVAMTGLARAQAYRANALRVQGNLHQAEAILKGAVALFDAEGTADPLVQGELMELSASVARDQRKLVEAEGFLAMAQGLYQECEESLHLCRVLVSKGTLFFETGDVEGALKVAAEALKGITREAAPWLYLCAAHNIADYLAELGRHAEAREVIASHRDLYEAFRDDAINLRRVWIEGKIDRMEGRYADAEKRFTEAKTRFVETGLGYDAALVSLDLALLYLEIGERQRVRRVAEEMVAVFMAEDIHREAAAAVILFQEAARQEAVTVPMIAELVAYLRRVRGRPKEQVS